MRNCLGAEEQGFWWADINVQDVRKQNKIKNKKTKNFHYYLKEHTLSVVSSSNWVSVSSLIRLQLKSNRLILYKKYFVHFKTFQNMSPTQYECWMKEKKKTQQNHRRVWSSLPGWTQGLVSAEPLWLGEWTISQSQALVTRCSSFIDSSLCLCCWQQG